MNSEIDTKFTHNKVEDMEIEDNQENEEDRSQAKVKIEDTQSVKKKEEKPSVAAKKISTNMEPSAAAKLGNLIQCKLSLKGGLVKSTIDEGTRKKSRDILKKKGKGRGVIKKINFGHIDQNMTSKHNHSLDILCYFKPVPIVISPDEDLINRN